MTSSGTFDPESDTGYRLEQLAGAFDRVRHSRDWRGPIRAVIPAEDRSLVEKAVLWFMNTAPAFEPLPGEDDRLVVTAPGSPTPTATTRSLPSPPVESQPTQPRAQEGEDDPSDDPWGLDGRLAAR